MNFRKSGEISNIMKIRLLEDELFHSDRRTDRHEANNYLPAILRTLLNTHARTHTHTRTHSMPLNRGSHTKTQHSRHVDTS